MAICLQLEVTRVIGGNLHKGPLTVATAAETGLNPAYSRTFNLKREPNGNWTIALCALDQSR
jgi:hypothetical protein